MALVGTIREQLLDQLAPIMTDDFEDYLTALASMFAQVEQLALDEYDAETETYHPGWTILLDPQRCPEEALPYLAQFAGERLPDGLALAYKREWIEDAPNQLRGTRYSIFRAAQRKLIGGRLVLLVEREGGDEDTLAVATLAAETPDPFGTYYDLLDVVPADLVFSYEAVSGEIWSGIEADYASWADVVSDFADWSEVASSLAGFDGFSREPPSL